MGPPGLLMAGNVQPVPWNMAGRIPARFISITGVFVL